MFPPHYPSVPPKIRFTSEVYHPLITDHGDFSLRPMGKWIPGNLYLTNVLHFMKHSFKKKGLESLRETWCVNPDAFKLYSSPFNEVVPLAFLGSLMRY
jgi:ubiquitin-protein ligase